MTSRLSTRLPNRLANADRRHWFLLIVALGIGLLLRFLNLTGKPLWMDEAITALFSFGQTYDAVPLERGLPGGELTEFLQLNRDATCSAIATNVMTQSVHPPLFFCLMHSWLKLFSGTSLSWVWQIRALPALFGTAAIGLAYTITRKLTGDRRAAMLSTWFMAVSPFGVYLSQEARHYTLPMLLVMLGLLGVRQIQQDWQRGRINPWVWVGWVACQTLGFYVHYFYVLATIGQVGALFLWQWWHGEKSDQKMGQIRPTPFWIPLAFAVSAMGFTYGPWLPIFISHMRRPETNWMRPFEPTIWTNLAPFGQLPVGWLSMIAGFPVEGQPLWIQVPTILAMAAFGVWVGWQSWKGLQSLWRSSEREAVLTIGSFLWIILSIFLVIIFVLKKDITQVPRYNFIYYPAVILLLGIALNRRDREIKTPFGQSVPFYLGLIGCLSSLFINANLVFQKPYHPEQLAALVNQNPDAKTLVVMGYETYQEIALGLSFVMAMQDVNPQIKFAFLSRSPNYGELFVKLAQMPTSKEFWLIGPGMLQADFPKTLQVGQKRCALVPDRHYRDGIPYQGYRC
jgi:uncharacterized membrane protein